MCVGGRIRLIHSISVKSFLDSFPAITCKSTGSPIRSHRTNILPMLQSLVIHCPLRGPYRQYHPVIKVLAQTGQVPAEIKREIPASTWHDWRRRDHTHAIGSDLVGLIQQDAPVLNACLSRAAFRKIIHAGYRLLLSIDRIVGEIRGAVKAIKNAKQRIAALISRDNITLGLKAMTSAFGISTQTYYRWKRSIPCPSSLKNLCRRLHPAQLTKDEVAVIRDPGA